MQAISGRLPLSGLIVVLLSYALSLLSDMEHLNTTGKSRLDKYTCLLSHHQQRFLRFLR